MRVPDVDFLHAAARSLAARVLLACAMLLAASAHPVTAQPSATARGSLERSVKAAFLYKFLGYVEFPASAFADPAAPVVLGVIGSEAMAAELVRIVTGRTVGNRPVVVRSLKEGEPAAGVHLLFVAGSDSARAIRAARDPASRPLLLVSESQHGLQEGSVINFRIIDDRVRFEVSLDAADRHSVKLSSRLLTVAYQVHKGVE